MRKGKVSILFQSILASESSLRLWDLRGARFKKIQILSSNKYSALTIKIMSTSGSTTSRTKSCWIARLRSLKNSFRYNQYNASSPSVRQPIQSHIGQAIAKEMIEMTQVSITTCPRPTVLCLCKGKRLLIPERTSAVTSYLTAILCPVLSHRTKMAISHQRATKCPQPSLWQKY